MKRSLPWLAAALTLVAAELLVHPLLVFSIGWTSRSVNLVLAAVMLGFAAGASGLLSGRGERLIFGLAFLFASGAAVFFPELSASPSLPWQVLAFLGAMAALMSPGLLFCRQMYSGGSEPASAYRRLHMIAVVFVFCVAAALVNFGFRFSFSFLACLFLVLALMPASPSVRKNFEFQREGLLTLLCSLVAAGFLTSYFEVVHLALRPSAIEFPVYLALSFLALGFSPAGRLGRSAMLIVAGYFSFLAILWLGPALFVEILGCKPGTCGVSHHFRQGIVVCTFLFLPYLFFASIVPLREREAPRVNHLFYSSLGSLLGLLLFGILGANLSFGWLLVGWNLLTVITLLSLGARNLAIIAALPAVLFWRPGLDIPAREWIVAGIASRFPSPGAYSGSTKHLENMERRGGETGYLIGVNGSQAKLGLGGYAGPLYHLVDQVRPLAAIDLLPEGSRRVLLLGLGTHSSLATLHYALKKKGMANVQIDVVDNFAPFSSLQFRENLGQIFGFSWVDPGATQFHLEDAVSFVLRQPPGSYDAVVWNLTLPFFGQLNRIYTVEFLQGVKRLLHSEGIFVANSRPGYSEQCLFARAGTHAYQVFVTGGEDLGFVIASNRVLRATPLAASCENRQLATFDRPFSAIQRQPPRISLPPSALLPQEMENGMSGKLLRTVADKRGLLTDNHVRSPGALNLSSFSAPGKEGLSAFLLCLNNPFLRTRLQFPISPMLLTAARRAFPQMGESVCSPAKD
jgi:hypothetical protein